MIAPELRSEWDDNTIHQRDRRHQTSYLGEDDEDFAIQDGFAAAEVFNDQGQDSKWTLCEAKGGRNSFRCGLLKDGIEGPVHLQ